MLLGKFVIVGMIVIAVAAGIFIETTSPPVPSFDELGEARVEEEIESILATRSDDWVPLIPDTFGSVGYPMLAIDDVGDYAPFRVDAYGRVYCAHTAAPERARPKFESNFP